MNQYPKGKTQAVTEMVNEAGVGFYRVFSEKRQPKAGPYQRVKYWGVNSRNADLVIKAFEANGFRNARFHIDDHHPWCSGGVIAEYPL